MTTVIWGEAEARSEALVAELERITPILKSLPDVTDVWLFGSFIEDRVHAGSDLDILVIRETDEPYIERTRTLWRAIRPQVPIDFFVYTQDEVKNDGRFIRYIKKHGRKL